MGFTLIEVILALAIMGLMLSIGWGALRNVAESRRLLSERQTIDLIGHSIVTRLVREIQLTTASLPLMPPSSQPNALFGGQDSFLAEQNDGSTKLAMTFLALEGGQYLPDGGRHSGVVQISYRLLPTPPEEGRAADSLSLIRSEMPYLRPFANAYKQEMIFPISHNVIAADFEFYDENQSQWSKTWKPSSNSGVPALVRFSITIRSVAGRTQTYSSAVAIAR